MKKNCNGCRAFDRNGRCELGYKVQVLSKNTSVGYILERQIPLEECPKPKTYDELFRIKGLK